MNDFLKMDVFFVVSTGAVVVLAALLCIALYYAIRILRTAERIVKKAEHEVALLSADISDLRTSVRAEGFKWKHLALWWRRVLGARSKRADYKE